jgi:hypothetical protein
VPQTGPSAITAHLASRAVKLAEARNLLITQRIENPLNAD